MTGPRWRKVRRDLFANKQRAAILVLGILSGTVAIGAVLGAYAILTRELSGAYLATRPASASLELDGDVGPELVREARRWPGVEDAEARGMVVARARVGRDWRRLLVFVVDDFGDLRTNLFRPEEGAWPPPAGTILIERTAASMLEASTGDVLTIRIGGGARHAVAISGTVHDAGLAPAWQDRGGYAYTTRETLSALGEEAPLDELRIVAEAGKDPDRVAVETAERLRAMGRTVREVRVPPPGQHPHQFQTTSVLLLLVGCALATAALGAVLAAAVMSALMARQVREIAIMKAIGARPAQIAAMYLALVAALGAAATALSIVPAMGMSHVFSGNVARLLNFELESVAIPWWVFAAEAAVGIALPTLAALVPVRNASRATVREALGDHGVSLGPAFGRGRLDRLLSGVGGSARPLLMAARNAFRQRRRLLLTTALLGIGGAMFVSSFDVTNAWQAQIDEVYETRFYDLELRLREPLGEEAVLREVRRVPGVRAAEGWGWAPAVVDREGALDVARTYPDEGHGSFALLAPPAGSSLVRFDVLAGKWVDPSDTDAVVLNHMAAALLPAARVGDAVSLVVAGRPARFRVAGVVREIGSPAAAYVSPAALARATASPGVRLVRVAVDGDRGAAIQRLEDALERAGVPVESALPLAELRTAVGDHMTVLVRLLLSMAVLLAFVGALGLASSMGVAVAERRRELGVIRVLGATPSAVVRGVVAEGVVTALVSWPVALALAAAFSAGIGAVVGAMSFRAALPVVLSWGAALGWLALTVVVGAAASAAPALAAARVSPREAIEHP